jgi:cyanophycinase
MLSTRSLLLTALLSACAAPQRQTPTETGLRGSLVIAGGGMSDNSVKVREAFLARRLPGPVGVIGAASSDPEGSARRGVSALNETIGGQFAVALPFDASKPELAHDPEVAAMIGACGGLWFTGGSQSRILEALRPDGADTLAWRACMDLLDRGGVIGGSSAGAAMMCDPMIRRGRSVNALHQGVGPDGVELGQGMGFFPWGIVDQHFLERGRFGRLVVALGEVGAQLGWGVSEDSALVVDRATGWVEVIGDDGLALFDASAMSVTTGRFDGLRLSLLGEGDKVHALTGEVFPSENTTPLTPDGEQSSDLATDALFTATALSDAVNQLARTTSMRGLLSDGGDCALLCEDHETSSWRALTDPTAEEPSTTGLRLDLYRMTY